MLIFFTALSYVLDFVLYEAVSMPNRLCSGSWPCYCYTLGFDSAGKVYTARLDNCVFSNLEIYTSLSELANGSPPQGYITLPFRGDSIGFIVFKSSFYYIKSNTRSIVKINLKTKAWQQKQLPDGVSNHNGGGRYKWSGYTDIDFEVDGDTLWMIYAYSPTYYLAFSRVAPETLDISDPIIAGVQKITFAGGFILHIVFYGIHSYSTMPSYVSSVFDIHKKQLHSLHNNLQLRAPDGYSISTHTVQFFHAQHDRRVYVLDRNQLRSYNYTSSRTPVW